MNCCDDQGHCTQGQDCPIRAERRRYRAGEPAQQPLPPLPIQYAEPEPPEDLTRLDWVLIGLFVACIAFFLFVTLWGWV